MWLILIVEDSIVRGHSLTCTVCLTDKGTYPECIGLDVVVLESMIQGRPDFIGSAGLVLILWKLDIRSIPEFNPGNMKKVA